jgi:DNA-binding response OmpR family regulator
VSTKTVLVVDDEERLLSVVKAYLLQNGFDVLTARNGREALSLALQKSPDLILLDVMMPELDGLEFLRRYREKYQTPVIMLTARVDESDKVIGLELGADDYVTKPFSPRELIARLRAVLRRNGQNEPETRPLRAQDVVLDRSAHTVEVDGQHVDLTPSEFDLLTELMATPGRAFTRLELLDRLQETADQGCERTIDVHIKNLRGKIEPAPQNPRYIETVYGVGYRFASADS